MGCCKYNFDEIINRRHHHSKKWTDWSGYGLQTCEDVLPLWIADMDFKCEPRILDALHETVNYGVIGYDAPPKDYYDPFISWQKRKNDWELRKEWFVDTPGIVPGISNAIISLTEKGDKILIQPPVYYPFFKAINFNDRTLVENTLLMGEDRYEIDFEDFEQKIRDCKMFILCNPHNPVGRVFTREELRKMGELCVKHNVIILSDEIHGDLIMKGHKHIPIASLSEEIKQQCLTFTAPSKTFNIAGLAQSVAIIPNEEFRAKFKKGMEAFGIMHMASFGITGFHAAYLYGEEWVKQVLEYIEGNIDFVMNFLKEQLPIVKAYKPEGTFLMWLDFRALSEDINVVDELLIKKAKVLMDSGAKFGETGQRFYRLNIASPRAIIEEAMNRIKQAIMEG